MKTRMVLNVTEHDRLVIAKYFAAAAPEGTADRSRTRATRKQVQRFAAAAVRYVVREHVPDLRGRARTAARRLLQDAPPPVAAEQIAEPSEKQQRLL